MSPPTHSAPLDTGRRDCVHCGLPVPATRGAARTAEPFCCFGCRFAHELIRPVSGGEAAARVTGVLAVRLGLGIFLSLNIMVFSWIFYSREFFGEAAARGDDFAALAGLFAYLLMFLCTCVIALIGLPLFADAVDGLRARRIDANLLIVIGVLGAYALSVGNTLRGSGSLYYDTAAMVLVLVTLGNYLEASARRRAMSASSALLDLLPATVFRRSGGALEQVRPRQLRAGDRIRVRPGEGLAADGIVVGGTARVDRSRLTGESRPLAVATGDPVLAGTVSVDGELWVEVRQTGDATVIGRLRRLLHEARERPPAVQRLADRVAALFVPAVVLLALGVFVWNVSAGNAPRGLLNALSVLLISCPCALGLAAPLASWAALHRAARRGVVFDAAATLERAAAVGHVLFDKTGTLTHSRTTVERVVTAAGVERERALTLAATVEESSLHPIARSVVELARREGVTPRETTDVNILPGVGVAARVGGRRYRMGGESLLHDLHGGGGLAAGPESLSVYLVDDERALARFDLVEELRGDARATIEQLRSLGVTSSGVTGDRESAARRLETELGISVSAAQLPEDKLQRLHEVRLSVAGQAVAMVGDGVNDAPVLAAADVGFAMAGATDLARHAGAVHLMADRLSDVPLALRIARSAVWRIRISLAWAFGYNTIGLALAAAGLLSPVFAATSMILSSLIVTAVARGAGRPADEPLPVDAGAPAGAAPPAGSVPVEV